MQANEEMGSLYLTLDNSKSDKGKEIIRTK